ncbi:MAG: SRPBCC family protein [Trueperaceae bacterium]|nr:SRPBCC family protein [Trueperaceae bacterium]
MIEIDVRRTVPAPADDVWNALRSFEGIENWLPVITRSEVRGEGAGATRVCTMTDGGQLRERLEEVDDDQRRLTYTIEEAPMPVQDYRSTMQVVPEGDSASTVVWAAQFGAPEGAADELESTMRTVYESGLDGLRAWFTRP